MRVLVASDNPIFRESLAQFLVKELHVKASGFDPSVGLHEAGGDANVVLCPAHGSGGLESTLASLKATFPCAKLVVLLLNENISVALTALQAGVDGILDSAVDAQELASYLAQVTRGEFAIPGQLARRLVCTYRSPDQNLVTPVLRGEGDLTARETEVLGLLAAGWSNRDIADRLSLSEHTVRAHLRGIMQKLHVKNRVQAAAYAWQGLLPSGLSEMEGKVRYGHTGGRR